jgi:hypothetical protein
MEVCVPPISLELAMQGAHRQVEPALQCVNAFDHAFLAVHCIWKPGEASDIVAAASAPVLAILVPAAMS